MSYVRTPEHRCLRAEPIRKWRPWEKSTGPKTPAGKAKVARNAERGGTRALLRQVARLQRDTDEGREAIAKAVEAVREMTPR